MKDSLILTWNCNQCVQVKFAFNFEKAFEDNSSGKNGASLSVFYSFSNTGFKHILELFGINNVIGAPVLIKHSGEVVTNLQEIIDYMKVNY